MRIEKVEVACRLAPKVTRVQTRSQDLPEQFMTNTLVRVYTDTGVEGVGGVTNYTSFDFDRYTGETLRHLVPILIGAKPARAGIDLACAFGLGPSRSRRSAIAAIDIALWDLVGRVDGLPLYQLLGEPPATESCAYASTPLLPDVTAYLRFVEKLVEEGFRAVKFHAWCIPDKDVELAGAIRKNYPGTDVDFMQDAENNYDRSVRPSRGPGARGSRVWLAGVLFPDYELDAYRELTSRVNIPVLPSGNWFQDLPSFHAAPLRGLARCADRQHGPGRNHAYAKSDEPRQGRGN